MDRKKVIAIPGSTRKLSTNHLLLKAIAAIGAERLDIDIFERLENIPPFNPDSDVDGVPAEVNNLREQLNKADGIIICTPEYAHGVPGTLKNLIDWTVSSSNFSHKPTILITASTDGKYGHAALLETLKVIEAKNVMNLQLIVSFIKTKINPQGKIIDEKILNDVKQLIHDFIETLNSIDTDNSGR
ncbi:MAG: NADPH-dependent FMN reductase [Ginsengibacter sp.]